MKRELRLPIGVEPGSRVAIDIDVARLRALGLWSRRRVALPSLISSKLTQERVLYTAAALSYVAIGVFVTELVLSWVVGFSWLMLWVWVLPALVRRLRR